MGSKLFHRLSVSRAWIPSTSPHLHGKLGDDDWQTILGVILLHNGPEALEGRGVDMDRKVVGPGVPRDEGEELSKPS